MAAAVLTHSEVLLLNNLKKKQTMPKSLGFQTPYRIPTFCWLVASPLNLPALSHRLISIRNSFFFFFWREPIMKVPQHLQSCSVQNPCPALKMAMEGGEDAGKKQRITQKAAQRSPWGMPWAGQMSLGILFLPMKGMRVQSEIMSSDSTEGHTDYLNVIPGKAQKFQQDQKPFPRSLIMTESLRLEKSSKVIKSNHSSALPLSHIPKRHIFTFLESSRNTDSITSLDKVLLFFILPRFYYYLFTASRKLWVTSQRSDPES